MSKNVKFCALPPVGAVVRFRPGGEPYIDDLAAPPQNHEDSTLRNRDLERLARFSFDVFWEANVVEDALHITIHPLRDLSADFGLPPGSFEPFTIERWYSVIHPADRAAYLGRIVKTVVEGSEYKADYRTVHADGSSIWWEDAGSPVESDGNRALRWIGAARNVTERREREEQLHQALHELHTIKARLEAEITLLRGETGYGKTGSAIIGRSVRLQQVVRQSELVAATEATVLLTGETGTGKSLIARAIHGSSRRADKPLITVNCAALPASLIESEIFGHEKGAFTGATSQRPGRFEIADGGTLFLDEVGELPPETQGKLLRLLETGEFERVGSNTSRKVDVRLIAATNRDLDALSREGYFRTDLYYRLNVFPVAVPALRERPEDIPLLATYILEKKCVELGRGLKRLTPEQSERLREYDWPGNIRELENVIERAIILSRDSDLDIEVKRTVPAQTDALRPLMPVPEIAINGASLQEVERAHILAVCESTHWKIKGADGAAVRLGLTPGTLYFRMKKLGIQRPEKNGPPVSPESSAPDAI